MSKASMSAQYNQFPLRAFCIQEARYRVENESKLKGTDLDIELLVSDFGARLFEKSEVWINSDAIGELLSSFVKEYQG